MNKEFVYDVEIYPNYYGVGFLDLGTAEVTQFSSRRGNIDDLRPWWDAHRGNRFYSFNGRFYDDHLLYHMMTDERDPAEFFGMSSARIKSKDKFAAVSPLTGTVDLRMILGDAAAGLKELGVKLDHQRLQELPYPFDADLTPEQMDEVEAYNLNDLEITDAVVRTIRGQIDARDALGAVHGINLIERKDSGLAEAVLRKRLFKNRAIYSALNTWTATGVSLIDAKVDFVDPALTAALEIMRGWALTATVIIEGEGIDHIKKLDVSKPAALEVKHRDVTYSLGLGGLHSRDTAGVYRADDDYELLDIDVELFYPNLIRSKQLYPSHLQPGDFLQAFGEMLDARVAAKREGKQALNLGLKIAINSIFGKFASPYSWLCDPRIGWTITINGQLILLMLVECLSAIEGVEVLSANTDGVLIRAARSQRPVVDEVVAAIETRFSLRFEFTAYQVYARRDVNNYLAVTEAGKVKGRGAYAYDRTNLMKKATERVVVDAVQQYFQAGVPVADTIMACRDITAFIDYFKASPGWALQTASGDDRGTLLRWYRCQTGEGIRKIKLGEDKTEVLASGMPVAILADLPAEFPGDVCCDHYVAAAQTLIDDIEKPRIDRQSTLAIADMNREQVARFAANHAEMAADDARVAAAVASVADRYVGASSKYDAMKRAMISCWIEGRGRMTRGDLLGVAGRLDAGTGYFGPPAKQKALEGLAEWIARNISPFPREYTLAEIADDALAWARGKVKPLKRPKIIDGRALINPRLMAEFAASGDRAKLARSLAAGLVKHRLDDGLADLLAEVVGSPGAKAADDLPVVEDEPKLAVDDPETVAEKQLVVFTGERVKQGMSGISRSILRKPVTLSRKNTPGNGLREVFLSNRYGNFNND